MDLTTVLQRLYGSKINVTITTPWTMATISR
jgi:hypothetical protein